MRSENSIPQDPAASRFSIKRFTMADEQGLEHNIENQRNWNDLVIGVQDIQ